MCFTCRYIKVNSSTLAILCNRFLTWKGFSSLMGLTFCLWYVAKNKLTYLPQYITVLSLMKTLISIHNFPKTVHFRSQKWRLPFTFSQMENLPSSSNVGLPVPGESFWQCKSPVQSSQVWSWSSSSVLELNHCLMNHLLIGYTVNSFLLKGAKSIISFSWNQHIQ